MRPFFVDLSLSNDAIEAEFHNYLSKNRISDTDSNQFSKVFQESILPRLSGMRDLNDRGSNIEFRKEIKIETGALVVEINTSPPNLIGRIRNFFGR